MNKSFLKIFTFSLLASTVLMGCAALEDKPVEGPKPWIAETATKIDKDNKSSFTGNYMITGFTQSPNNTIIGIDKFAGGVVIAYSDSIQYNYALKYGSYLNTSSATTISNNNTVLNDNDFTVAEDGYTLNLTTPITISADGKTYTITTLKKSDDRTIIIDNNINLENFYSPLVKLCDPTLTPNINDVNSCGESGAMNYIGYYRIENITCDGVTYNGGSDFAGEMTASADLTQLGSNIVTVPITTKFQVSNAELKSCILTSTETSNSNLYFKQSDFIINLSDTGGFSSDIFAKVGLIAISNGDETERRTYISYEPKDTNFSDLAFNNKKVSMKLRIMQPRVNNGQKQDAPVTLTNKTYF